MTRVGDSGDCHGLHAESSPLSERRLAAADTNRDTLPLSDSDKIFLLNVDAASEGPVGATLTQLTPTTTRQELATDAPGGAERPRRATSVTGGKGGSKGRPTAREDSRSAVDTTRTTTALATPGAPSPDGAEAGDGGGGNGGLLASAGDPVRCDRGTPGGDKACLPSSPASGGLAPSDVEQPSADKQGRREDQTPSDAPLPNPSLTTKEPLPVALHPQEESREASHCSCSGRRRQRRLSRSLLFLLLHHHLNVAVQTL
jgi:hypothetical protein